MTSFELFRLLKFNKKSIFYIYFHTFFSLNRLSVTSYIISCKRIIFFASNYGIITDIKIKLCK